MANLIVNIEDHSRPPDSLFSPLIIRCCNTVCLQSHHMEYRSLFGTSSGLPLASSLHTQTIMNLWLLLENVGMCSG